MIDTESGRFYAAERVDCTTAGMKREPREFSSLPPSESVRQAQASAERPSNGAGGASRPKPDACERCKKKYNLDGHVKAVHWARRSQAWLCLWCVFEMPENQ